jgi:hypothetical protein
MKDGWHAKGATTWKKLLLLLTRRRLSTMSDGRAAAQDIGSSGQGTNG